MRYSEKYRKKHTSDTVVNTDQWLIEQQGERPCQKCNGLQGSAHTGTWGNDERVVCDEVKVLTFGIANTVDVGDGET
jgi:hypothetical protein